MDLIVAMGNITKTSKKIRKAKRRELDEIVELANKTFDASYRSFLGDENVDWYINTSELKREIVIHLEDLYVLTLDTKIVGFIIYFNNFIHIMMVDTTLHHEGLGSYILNEIEKELFKTNDKIRLQSFIGNKVATNFYLKNGWTKEDTDDNVKDTTMIYFEKKK